MQQYCDAFDIDSEVRDSGTVLLNKCVYNYDRGQTNNNKHYETQLTTSINT